MLGTDLNNCDGKSNIEGNSLEDFTHNKSSSPANSCRRFLLPLHCQAPQTQSPWIGISLPWKASSLSTFKQTSILEFLHRLSFGYITSSLKA
jgi:hypothetical protein